MPDFINAVQTKDAYDITLELAPAAWTKAITFSVITATGQSQANPVLATWAKFPPKPDGSPDFGSEPTFELVERLYVGNTVGAVSNEWAGGVKFRSAGVGAPSVIAAERDFQTDIIVAAGNVTSANVNASGGTSPPIVPGINVMIAFAGATGVVSAGSGASVVRSSPGVYVVTYSVGFAATPLMWAQIVNSLGVTEVSGPSAAGCTLSTFTLAGAPLDPGAVYFFATAA